MGQFIDQTPQNNVQAEALLASATKKYESSFTSDE